MNIVESITRVSPFDWVALGLLVVMFILGFAQGAIRRLLGIAVILFAFLLAANLRDSLGSFLTSNWTQWPREYDFMLAFGFLFVVASIAFSILIQGLYKHTPISARAPIVDELVGGLLGLVQAVVVLGAIVIILGSFFQKSIPIADSQVQWLRDLNGAVDASATASIFRTVLLPPFLAVSAPFLPPDLRLLFPFR